jgi:predicted lactoylglutathione lyase
MTTSVFINLPVTDLDASKRFFSALGWTVNPDFTNDDAAALVVSDTIYVMLLTHGHFERFTKKPIADATATTEVLNALSFESRAEVDEIVDKALAAGASIYSDTNDHGFMYQRAFADLDGHQWEVFWMDDAAARGDWATVAERYPDLPPMG